MELKYFQLIFRSSKQIFPRPTKFRIFILGMSLLVLRSLDSLTMSKKNNVLAKKSICGPLESYSFSCSTWDFHFVSLFLPRIKPTLGEQQMLLRTFEFSLEFQLQISCFNIKKAIRIKLYSRNIRLVQKNVQHKLLEKNYLPAN